MADGDFNNLARIAKQMHQAASQIVAETAAEIVMVMQPITPVDTGYLQSSEYYVTTSESTYGQAEGKGESFPEVDAPENDTTAYAAVAATHGGFVNYGTRKMAAQPFFEPAIETARPHFIDKMGNLESRIKQ